MSDTVSARISASKRFWKLVGKFLLLVGIPMLFALAAGIWADMLLTIDSPPNTNASGMGFDVSSSFELGLLSPPDFELLGLARRPPERRC